MALEDVLLSKKKAVVKRWFELIAQTHPDGGASLIKNKDRFANPVGHITSSAIDTLYEELLRGKLDSQKVAVSLEDIIKVRAVQDFSPSQAVVFVFLLKDAIKAEFKDEKYKKGIAEELYRIESQIDQLAFRAFDVYMDCREKLYKVKVDEMKAAVENANRLLEKLSVSGAGL